MDKLDIAKTPLYIKQKINVFKKHNPKSRRMLPCGSRHSDAFIYILEGKCSYMFADETEFSLSVQTGEILYLAKNASYTMYIHTDDIRFIYVDFEFDDDHVRKCDVYKPQNPSAAQSMFEKLYQCQKKAGNASFSEGMSALYDIYGLILSTAERPYLEKGAKHKISQVKQYMDENFKDPALSVAELAQRAEMSEVHFRKLFKSQFDFSPSQYMSALRLKSAKDMMQYPFFSLEDCALQSGFASLQYFSRVFKKSTGMTPSEYRKQK